jgi:hypothetical protein
VRYRLHLEVKMSEDRLLKFVSRYRRYAFRQLRKTKTKDVWIQLLRGEVQGKKGMRVFHAEIISTKSGPIYERYLKQAMSIVQAIVDNLAKGLKLDGDARALFILKKKKHRLRGIVLPVSFALEDDAVQRIGEATLSGLELTFEKSPIGLDCAEVSVMKDEIWLSIQTGFYSSPTERVAERTFDQIGEIGTLFVEEETST